MKKYYANIKVSGNETDLGDFLLLCKKIEYLCRVGASRTIPVVIDGDGSADLQFDFGDIEVNIDELKLERELDSGENLENLYIGE